MQNKSFMFIFLAIFLAPFVVFADNDATAVLRFKTPGVEVEATYTGKYMTQCVARVVARGVGNDVREFCVAYTADATAFRGGYVFTIRENDGGSVRELQITETVVCTPEEKSVRREVTGRGYLDGAISIPPFQLLTITKRTRAIEMFGRFLVSWAKSNADLNACYRFEGDLDKLGVVPYMVDFAITPFEEYLAK